MRRLVAIDLAGLPGPSPTGTAAGAPHPVVGAIRRAWDDGDAVCCLDPRWPAPVRAAVLATLAPAAVLDADGEHRLTGAVPVSDGDAVVVTTSGTTGDPRGVVLTHDAVRASALATTGRLGLDADHDRWLACLPLAHIGGLAVVLRALVTGVSVEVHDGFDAGAVADAAARGATAVSLVATALARIDPAAFRTILLGGAAPPDTALPPNVVVTYGMTESGSGCVYDGVPLDGIDVRVDADGAISLRGPVLLRAYRTAATGPEGVDPRDPDGWFATGDLGAWQPGPDGTDRLVVHGRAGDVIVTGGEKVWPEPVEAVLRRQFAVLDAAVFGVPDPTWGQRVVAAVVCDGPVAPALGELRDHVRAHLPPWCAPRELVMVVQIPRTPSGKIRRAAMRAAHLRGELR
jgi:O-succinylbenzoic acid--CoA ligase